MSIYRLLLAAAVVAIAACHSPVSAATDCYYDKTASAAPGNLVCSPSAVPGDDSFTDGSGFAAN